MKREEKQYEFINFITDNKTNIEESGLRNEMFLHEIPDTTLNKEINYTVQVFR